MYLHWSFIPHVTPHLWNQEKYNHVIPDVIASFISCVIFRSFFGHWWFWIYRVSWAAHDWAAHDWCKFFFSCFFFFFFLGGGIDKFEYIFQMNDDFKWSFLSIDYFENIFGHWWLWIRFCRQLMTLNEVFFINDGYIFICQMLFWEMAEKILKRYHDILNVACSSAGALMNTGLKLSHKCVSRRPSTSTIRVKGHL